jgi:hypothetical protein
VRDGVFFDHFFLGSIKKTRQSANIFGIKINGIGYLAAMSAALALEVNLNLDAQIIIGI